MCDSSERLFVPLTPIYDVLRPGQLNGVHLVLSSCTGTHGIDSAAECERTETHLMGSTQAPVYLRRAI